MCNKQFGRHALYCTLLATIVSLVVGCAAIAPGNDPIVVNAERTLQAAQASADAFVHFDADNKYFLKQEVPAVHEFAQTIRVQFPPAMKAALAARDVYKSTKTTEASADLEDNLRRVSDLASQARQYLVAAQTARTKSTSRPSK